MLLVFVGQKLLGFQWAMRFCQLSSPLFLSGINSWWPITNIRWIRYLICFGGACFHVRWFWSFFIILWYALVAGAFMPDNFEVSSYWWGSPLIHQRFKKWSSSSRWVLLVVDFLQVAYSSWPQRMCWAVCCVQFIQQSSRWPQPCSRHKENSFCHINYGTGCGLCLFLYMSSQITHQYQHKILLCCLPSCQSMPWAHITHKVKTCMPLRCWYSLA